MTATTDETPWCLFTSIDFHTGFAPCIILSIHQNKYWAQQYADALNSDDRWSVKAMLVEYTESVSKLKMGDYLLGKKIDVVMDMSGDVTVAEGNYED